MKNYDEYINRMIWDMICKSRPLYDIIPMIKFPAQSRSYGKTMTTRALYREIINKFASYFQQISIKWCNGFEFVCNGKRQYCYIYNCKVGDFK